MSEIRIAKSWDSIPPVLYDGDEAISTRVLEKQYREAATEIARQQAEIERLKQILSEYANVVPTSWLDPLLTGPNKALTGEAGEWGCHDIENLLNAIDKKLKALSGEREE